MKIFLAAVNPEYARKLGKKFNGLLTFAYLDPKRQLDMSMYKDFILDSGAFTYAFSTGDSSHIDWDQYCLKYANFVKANKVKNYMELDIDKLVGYEKVKQFRRTCEQVVGWPPIPVWHVNRGLKDWTQVCKDYKYVAIGGLRQEIGLKRFKYLQHFVDEAHKLGAKVHGLGYTRTQDIAKAEVMFDTVDSTSWLNASRFRSISKFDGSKMTHVIPQKQQKYACKLNWKELYLKSLDEWITYANYIERTTEHYAK